MHDILLINNIIYSILIYFFSLFKILNLNILNMKHIFRNLILYITIVKKISINTLEIIWKESITK